MKVRFEIGWGIERECDYTAVIRHLEVYVPLHIKIMIRNEKGENHKICVE